MLHLWRLDLPEIPPPEVDLQILPAAELTQATHLHRPALQARFLHGRVARRRILGGYLGVAPGQVRFRQGPHGKPHIAWPVPAPAFNLSHSGALCLIAIRWGSELGLDVEQVRPRSNVLAIARRMFPPPIVAQLEHLSAEERLHSFHCHWTRLESGVKVQGGRLFDADTRNLQDLCYTSFVPIAGFQACIAAQDPLPPPACWRTLAFIPHGVFSSHEIQSSTPRGA